ncbi:hypothetical protein SAMN04490248_12929 [Salinihabitans flavidus]|uniref:Uncharacterized protein n=1 Tax=Salinihabitans flavidus TaxID=569882 RepID=A0A1H8VIU4_9RHOB|nr:hypothetical protein [Salinihabitans flavidus]SEP14798.1 hypothetical protein SAMN04490248_12929 [Salinihabitans flavidus]
MRYDWILDVLADLQTFARSNGLELLSDQLEDSRFVATAEIVALHEGSGENHAGGHEAAAHAHIGGVGTRARA